MSNMYPETDARSLLALLEERQISERISNNPCFPGNLYQGFPIRDKSFVLVHECLHALYPRMDEQWICARTEEVYNILSPDEHKELFGFVENLP